MATVPFTLVQRRSRMSTEERATAKLDESPNGRPSFQGWLKASGLRLFKISLPVLRPLGWIGFKLTQPVAIIIGLLFFWNVFWRKNRMIVYGRENLRHGTSGNMLLSEHWSMIDSFMLSSLYGFRAYWQQAILFYSLPAANNYFNSWWMRLVMAYYKTIPVKASEKGRRRDAAALLRSIDVLGHANLSIFYAGTRQRPGVVYQAIRGTAVILLKAKNAKGMTPIAFTGMDEVQPYRKAPGDPPATQFAKHPHLDWILGHYSGKTIRVMIGKPIPIADLWIIYNRADTAGLDGYQAVADHMAKAVVDTRLRLLVISNSPTHES